MLFIRILHYILGYVRFRICGDYPERLLNILAAKGVSVWDAEYKNGCIEASVYIRDYKRMHALKGKCRVTTRYIRPIGLFIKLKAYRRRIGFGVGFAVYVFLICWLSGFIWQIELVGCVRTDPQQLLTALEELGVYVGARTAEIDAFSLPEKIQLKVPYLAWSAVNIEGSLATIDVSEIADVPDKTGEEPCNLVARIGGTITGHRVTCGNLAVEVGSTVVAGDLLVSGTIEYATGYTGLKHAAGEVYARTEHRLQTAVSFRQEEMRPTGREKSKAVVSFFGQALPLYLGSEQYPYEKVCGQHDLRLLEKRLPITLYTAVFYETERVEYTLSLEEAVEKARKEMEVLTKTELAGMDILSQSENIVEQNDGIYMENLCICNENIADEEILSITTINE